MKIICINGYPQSGKDTFVNFCYSFGSIIQSYSTVDFVKRKTLTLKLKYIQIVLIYIIVNSKNGIKIGLRIIGLMQKKNQLKIKNFGRK